MRVAVVVLVLCALAGTLPAGASAAASWQSGTLQESQDFDCTSGNLEYGAGAYLSYYADPANPPQVGDVFYVSLDMTGIGTPCAGIYGNAHLVLPAGLSTAVSATYPVKCFFQVPGKGFQQDSSNDCPQSLPFEAFAHGTGYSLNPQNTNPPFWPLPSGLTIEVQVPVVATTPQNGSPAVQAAVDLSDGQSNPSLFPNLNVIVNPANAGNVAIGVVYNTPSINTQSQPTTNGPVEATYTGYVQNNSNPGFIQSQLAKASAPGDCTSPTTIYTTANAPLQIPQTGVSGSFTGLYPGGAYCWRIVAHVTSGPQTGEYDGNWRYFATIGTYLSGQSGQYVPIQDKPTSVSQCSTNGSGCSTSTCNISACAPGNGIADFSHTLAISLAGTGGGSVTGTGGISCSATCSRQYPSTSSPSITLTASPSPGSTFTGWTGEGCSGTGTCTVTMSASRSVTAGFDRSTTSTTTTTTQSTTTPTTTTTPSTGPGPNPSAAAVAKVGQTSVSGTTAGVSVSCSGSTGSCTITVTLSVVESLNGSKITGVSVAKRKAKKKAKRTVVVGSTTTTVAAGQTQTIKVALNGAGKRLLASRHRLPVKITTVQSGGASSSQAITFKATKRKTKR